MKLTKGLVLLAMAVVTGTMPNVAQQGPDGTVLVGNDTKHAAWVTIYRSSGRHDKVGWGCAPGNRHGVYINTKKPTQNSYSTYYVLVELKPSTTGDCNGGNLSVIEANQPMSGNTLIIKPTGNGSTATLVRQ